MANRVDCYAVAFTAADGTVAGRSVYHFFCRLNNLVVNDWRKTQRAVNEREIRLFSYYWDLPSVDRMVIPFGKRIEQGGTYAVDEADGTKLTSINSKLYHVNSIAYSERYNIAFLTTFRDGPRPRELEAYLSSFLDHHAGYGISLIPIRNQTFLEQIRRSSQVTKIDISLNLSARDQIFYRERAHNERSGLLQGLKAVADAGKKQVRGNIMDFSLRLGHHPQGDSMDKEAVVTFLSELALDSDAIQDIVLSFRDGTTDRLEPRSLKRRMIASGRIPGNHRQVTPELLSVNFPRLLDALFPKYHDENQQIHAGAVDIGEEYRIFPAEEGDMIVDARQSQL